MNTFYHVGREGNGDENDDDDGGNEMGTDQRVLKMTGVEKKAMEREFRIGAVGAADSTGTFFLISYFLLQYACFGFRAGC